MQGASQREQTGKLLKILEKAAERSSSLVIINLSINNVNIYYNSFISIDILYKRYGF
jgi:hypothetical protein